MKTLASGVVAGLLAIAASPAHGALPSDVVSLMDPTVDPCDDFYQYSCGGWLKNLTLPKGVAVHKRLEPELSKLTTATLKKIVEDRHPVLGEFYDSCLDMEANTALGNKPLQDALQRIQRASSKFELAKLGGELGTEGAWLFTNLGAWYSEYNQSQMALFAGTGIFPLGEDASAKFNETSKYILTGLKLAGVPLPANETKVVEAVISISDILLQINPPTEEYRAEEALTYEDRFPISFKAMAEGAEIIANSELEADSNIFFSSIGFYDRVEKQLWNAKSLEDIKYFYSFVHLVRYGYYLGDDFMANEDEYWGSEDREQRCHKQVIDLLPELVSEYFFAEAIGVQTQQYVLQMTETLKRTMAAHISKENWLDTATRVQAEHKVMLMKAMVGKQDKPVNYTFTLTVAT